MIFESLLRRVIKSSRNPVHTFTVSDRALKLGEEFGEFSEAVLHKQGKLPHKTMKEPVEGEAADVIITVIDTLAEAYLDTHTEEEILNMVAKELDRKLQIWERRLHNAIQNSQVK